MVLLWVLGRKIGSFVVLLSPPVQRLVLGTFGIPFPFLVTG